MRIIQAEDHFDPTAGYQINELVHAGKNFNDEVIILTSSDLSPFYKEVSAKDDAEYEKKYGVTIIRLDVLCSLSSRLILKKFWKTIYDLKPDLLFLHGLADFKDCILYKKKTLPFVIVRDCHMSWVGAHNRFRNLFYAFFKIFFSRKINTTSLYKKVLALGKEEYEYIRMLGINKDKIAYLPHGYNDSIMFFDKDARNRVRSFYGYDDSDIVISYIGKFNDLKRPDILFDIIHRLPHGFIEKHDIKLLFIGPKEDEYMDVTFNPKMEIAQKTISITIDSAKLFKDLKDYYSASDICVFPKETSLSSIHAQVCGCPVVMEDYASNVERVVNKKHLYSIDNLDEASLILQTIIKTGIYKKGSLPVDTLEEREYHHQIRILRNFSKDECNENE